MAMKSTSAIILFVCGLFSATQINIVGSIGITELFFFLVGPFVFIQDSQMLRKEGFMPLICLSIMTCISCVASSLHNNTYFYSALKGFAAPYSIFVSLVMFARLFRNNLSNLKWYLLGSAFSNVLNVFYFQSAAEVFATGAQALDKEASEAVMSGAMFWLGRIRDWLLLPIRGWYYQTPHQYSFWALFLYGVFSMLLSPSGRSISVVTIASAFLVWIGGKKVNRMRIISRHFTTMVLCGVVLAFVAKWGYSFAARNELLGEKAVAKYEAQTRHGTGFLSLLLSGRGETFVGLMACFENPLLGCGPWPIDDKGYYARFLRDYGAAEDYEQYAQTVADQTRRGIYLFSYIPAHSHLIGFWLWYGLPGLLLWLYVLKLYIDVMRRYIAAIPQLFGLIAITIPACLWGFFFSPFGYRVSTCSGIALMLIVRSVGKGRITLERKMVDEIYRMERT